MRLAVHQCLVLPAEDSASLVAMAAGEGIRPDMHDATKLAQKLADDEGEPFLVVSVARIVNPHRGGEE